MWIPFSYRIYEVIDWIKKEIYLIVGAGGSKEKVKEAIC